MQKSRGIWRACLLMEDEPRVSQVEQEGPRGYEHQYRVTAWLALEFWSDELAVRVERGEDAEFVVPPSTRVAVQIKRTTRDVDLEVLSVMLTHFGNLRADGSLLERIYSDKTLAAIFIMGGRCTDQLRPLIAGAPTDVLNVRVSAPLSADTARKLHELISNRKEGKSKLKQKRAHGLKELADQLGVDGLREVSKRIFILEQVTPLELASRGRELLNASFQVPRSEVDEIFSTKLRALVEAARDEGGDLIPRFRGVLGQFGRIFRRAHDVPRAEEPALFDLIERTGVLLLAGESKCGKTHFAEKVLQRYQDRGFEWLISDDVHQVTRFLVGDDPKRDRIAMLDDPLRQPGTHRALTDLVSRRPAHRKLVITSRLSDIRALGLAKSDTLAERQWIDLTAREPDFIERIWNEVSGDLDGPARAHVTRLIRSQSASVFQPGHVVHLSRREAVELASVTDDQLERLGRFEAASLWLDLDAIAGVSAVAHALSILTTTIEAVPMEELKNALDPKPRTLPGRSETISLSLHFGGSEETYRPPTYEVPLAIGEVHMNALSTLERMGIIKHEKERGTRPSHPTYAAALAHAHARIGSFEIESFLTIARRALFSANPRSATRAAKNLLSISQTLETDVRVDLVAVLCEALASSVYPNVRDVLLVGLVLRTEELDQKQRLLLFQQIEWSWHLNARIVWHDDEPHYDTRPSVPMHLRWAQRYARDEQPSRARSGSPRWLWDAILRETREPSGDSTLLRSALGSDHALVRGAAAFAIFSGIQRYEGDLVLAVLRDSHPQVLASATKGLLRTWPQQDPDTREPIVSMIARAIQRPEQSPLILGLLLGFEDTCQIYSDDEQIPWDALLRLLRPALLYLKPETRFNEPHLFDLIRRATLARADASGLAAAVGAWSRLLIRRAAVHEVSDYGASVFLLAVKALGGADPTRIEILDTILCARQSGPRMMTLCDAVSEWDSLSPSERARILAALAEARPDRRWAHAVAISVEAVSDEVLTAVLGDPVLFRGPAHDVLAQWPPTLLDDCITVQLRRHGYLAGLGIGNWSAAPWKDVIFEVARRPSHPRFMDVIRHLLGTVPEDPEFLTVWESACSLPKIIDQLFDKVLAETCSYNGWRGARVWDILVARSGEHQDGWLALLVENIEAIESRNNFDLLPRGMLERVFSSLSADSHVLTLLEFGKHTEYHALVQQTMKMVYERQAPRMTWVHEAVHDFVNGAGGDEKFLEIIDRSRRDSIHRASVQWEKWRLGYIYEGWIGVDEDVSVP